MNLTAIINNFKRPEYFARCVASLEKYYPTVDIVEVEDENLSRARNRGVLQARTDYVLFCDDDMEFTKHSNVQVLVHLMETVDIAGGHVEGLMYEGRFVMQPDDESIQYVPITHDYSRHRGIQYQLANFIPNFFVAKRRFLLNKPWDERMRISWEHMDFFLSANRRGLLTAYCPEAVVKHDKNLPVSEEYMRYRTDDESSRQAFFDKWGYKRIISMDGDILEPHAMRATIGV